MSVNIKENDALNGIAKLIPASNITLSSLPDTNITLPQAEQSLGYDEASGRWINYNVRISVYYSDDFRGLNISCTKGQTTITKTAPMDGNAVVFYVNEKGTWTVSAEIGATSYTDTVVVTSFGVTYPAQLVTSSSETPEGATVEPTDDIQIWLACANLDKPYTTLDAVLADRETFETLIADSNACDYMARSTTWAYRGLVPKMTSNTAPEGQCFASSVHTDATLGSQAWNAFDGNFDKAWHANTQQAFPQSVGYKFVNATEVKVAKVRPLIYQGNSRLKQYKFQASNDNSTWVDLTETLTADNQTTGTKMTQTYCYAGSWVEAKFTQNIGSYLYYRLVDNSSWDSNKACIVEVQFYSDVDITTDKDAMALIGKYDYCSNALLGNATWAEAIANSDYFEEVLNVKVPKMTSNTTPSGECISNVADTSSYYKYYAFDQNTSTAWAGAQSGNSYIGYKFTQQVVVDKAYFKTGNYYGRITSIKVQGSNDNFDSDIHDLSESITPTSDETTINLSSVGSYQYYRLYMSFNAAPIIYEVQFYGRASAQTNIIHSAPNDTIYYMEDGSPVTVATTNSEGDGILDFSSLEDKEYTFYSSVAKDPSNLSNDFSKTIRITKSEFGGTTEMYLMPDTIRTLYWYGYESNDLEDISTANGWSVSNSGYSFQAPTHNTNDIQITTTSNKVSGIGSKISYSNVTLNCIIKTTALAYSTGLYYGSSNKSINVQSLSNYDSQSVVDTIQTLSKSITSGYLTLIGFNGRNGNIYALWYE